eukprot:3184386-Rhodomonas_salina.1
MSAAPTQPALQQNETVSAQKDGGVLPGATCFDRAIAEAAKTRDNSDMSREQESHATRSRSRELNAGVQKLTEISRELEELSETATGVKIGEGGPQWTLEESTKTNPSLRDLLRHYAKWTSGTMVPLTAKLDFMSDKQLTKVLVHHNYVFKTPLDWMPSHMQDGKDGFLMVKKYCPGKN